MTCWMICWPTRTQSLGIPPSKHMPAAHRTGIHPPTRGIHPQQKKSSSSSHAATSPRRKHTFQSVWSLFCKRLEPNCGHGTDRTGAGARFSPTATRAADQPRSQPDRQLLEHLSRFVTASSSARVPDVSSLSSSNNFCAVCSPSSMVDDRTIPRLNRIPL